MIFDGDKGDVFYERFEVQQFSCSTSSYSLHIGSNYFSSEKIILDIESEALIIKGQVTADNLKPWPVTLFEPGWYGLVRLCAHYGMFSWHPEHGSYLRWRN
jgi:hypothetical protein